MAACSGLRVLEVAEGLGGASLCGQLFAGLDARVIKLEAPHGDPLRKTGPLAPDEIAHLFHLVNAGKHSVIFSQGTNGAQDKWNELLRWADVVLLEQPSHLVSERFFDPNTFRDRWPSKVLCTVSTFGIKSQRKHWTGNELIAEAMSGLLACSGYPEKWPVCSGVPYALHMAALFAFQGTMAALRKNTNRGQWLDLSVVDCLVALLGTFIPFCFLTGRSPKRVGNRHTLAAPWNLYPTQDGYVVICTMSSGGTGWWSAIANIIGRPELGADERYNDEVKRVQRVEEVDYIISEWTQHQTTQRVVDLMSASGIPVNAISPVEQTLSEPHYRETRAIIRSCVVQRGGKTFSVPLAGSPLKVGTWSPAPQAGPQLGDFGTHLPNSPRFTPLPKGTDNSRGLLSGIRVLEFATRTSAPMAGRILADLGAELVKIEPRKGDELRRSGPKIGGASYIFHINNAGKRSVSVDPKDPRGRDLILKLAAQSDVWIENLAPGATEAMGLGYTSVSGANPRIIYVSCSGFGHRSDYGNKRALDTVVQAACGIMHLTGYADHLPVKIGISAIDLGAAVGVGGAVLAGLRQRDLIEGGIHVDLAMADVGVWMTQAAWPEVFYGSGHPARLGNRSQWACPHNLFKTSDGVIAIAVETDDQWKQLLTVLGKPELIRDGSLATVAGRLKNIERVEDVITAWLADKHAADVAEVLQVAHVPAAPVRDLTDVVDDPDMQDRQLIVEVQHHSVGSMRLLGNPLNFSLAAAAVSTGAPSLGEHTNEVLSKWLRLSHEEIKALHDAGVVMTTST